MIGDYIRLINEAFDEGAREGNKTHRVLVLERFIIDIYGAG